MRSGNSRKKNLRIAIMLALSSLRRDYKGATRGLTTDQMEAMLKDLRRAQVEYGIRKIEVEDVE